MSDRLSLGPIQVTGTSVFEINDALRQIQERIDEARGLRGRAQIYDRLAINSPTATDDAAQLSTVRSPTITGDLTHTGDAVGFYSTTPVDQASAASNLTDNSGGTADDTIDAITDTANAGSADLDPVQDAVADLAAKVNKALTVLRRVGLMDT